MHYIKLITAENVSREYLSINLILITEGVVIEDSNVVRLRDIEKTDGCRCEGIQVHLVRWYHRQVDVRVVYVTGFI